MNMESTDNDDPGYVETKLPLPIGKKMLETDALLHVLPTTESHRRVPCSVGTSITDLVIESFNSSFIEQISQT